MYWIIEGRIRLTGSLKDIHEGWLQQFVSEDGDLCEGANLLRLCDQKGDHRTDEGQEAIEKTLSELRLSPSPSISDLQAFLTSYKKYYYLVARYEKRPAIQMWKDMIKVMPKDTGDVNKRREDQSFLVRQGSR